MLSFILFREYLISVQRGEEVSRDVDNVIGVGNIKLELLLTLSYVLEHMKRGEEN